MRISATAARRPARAKVKLITRLAEMPRERATVKSAAAARICNPIEVRLSSNPTAASIREPTTIDIGVDHLIRRLPSSNDLFSPVHRFICLVWLLHCRCMTARSRKLTANVIASIVTGEAWRIGRRARRSINTAVATTTTITTATRVTDGHDLVR
jgi:hypothetical protein